MIITHFFINTPPPKTVMIIIIQLHGVNPGTTVLIIIRKSIPAAFTKTKITVVCLCNYIIVARFQLFSKKNSVNKNLFNYFDASNCQRKEKVSEPGIAA